MFGLKKPSIELLDKYVANKEYDKALTAVATELKRNPSKFNLLLRQAEILGMAGNRDRAIAVYQELAEHYAKDGFFAKSIALYKKVLRLNPELQEAHAELALLIEEQGKAKIPLKERLAAQKSPGKHKPVEPADPTQSLSSPEEKERDSSSLFSAFPKEALEDILASTSLRSFLEGDIIVTEGEEGSSLFLLVTGEVKVFTRGEKGEHLQLAELGPGDFFGEVSLLTGRPRTATITAKTGVSAIELSRDGIHQIAQNHPQVKAVIKDFYESRAQATVEAVIQKMRDST
ncbi:MAG: cyclic nucleotide-binding domain-containing protein [Thermoanaerobaculales bacterium]|nr:cyclic nucleotide-binding domain-containing protein [Thermoanaerobaculales bacterium]